MIGRADYGASVRCRSLLRSSLAACGVLAAVAGVANAAAPAGRVVLRVPGQLTGVFDGDRVALSIDRDGQRVGYTVRPLSGHPVTTLRYPVSGLCRMPAGCQNGPSRVVLAGTRLAFFDGFSATSALQSQLFAGTAPGVIRPVTSWRESGTSPNFVHTWLTYAGQGDVLAYATQAGALRLYHATGSTTIATGIATVLAVNGRRIAVRTTDGAIELLDTTGAVLSRLRGVRLGAGTVAVAMQGNDLVFVDATYALRRYDVRTGRLRGTYELRSYPNAVALYDGVVAYESSGYPGGVRLLRLSDGRQSARIPLSDATPVSLSARGLDYLAYEAPDTVVRELSWGALAAVLR